jgi:hypothetical protein
MLVYERRKTYSFGSSMKDQREEYMYRFIVAGVISIMVAGFLMSCGHSTSTSNNETGGTELSNTTSITLLTVAPKKGRTYANIRMSPEGSSPKIADVPVGTELKSYTKSGSWYQVSVPGTMQLGWIKDIYFDE